MGRCLVLSNEKIKIKHTKHFFKLNNKKKKLIVDSDLKSPSNEEVKDLSLRTRKHRNKKRRKYYQNKNNFKKMVTILCNFIFLLLIIVIVNLPIFNVKSINVLANNSVDKNEIINDSNISLHKKIFSVFLSKRNIENKIVQDNKLVKNVSINTRNFNEVVIKVDEYPVIGYLYKKNNYHLVLSNGVIVKDRIVKQPKLNLPIYLNFKDDSNFHNLIFQYSKLPISVQEGISQINFSPTKADPERIHIFMNDGNQVYARISSFGRKMKFYSKMASEMTKKGIINLEVGAYSYPFGEKETLKSSKKDTRLIVTNKNLNTKKDSNYVQNKQLYTDNYKRNISLQKNSIQIR